MRAQGLTYSQLTRRSPRENLRRIVQDQITQIDAMILEAQTAGANRIDYYLPTTFSDVGMPRADAQLLVYSDLVDVYQQPEPQGKGFPIVSIDGFNGSAQEKPTLRVGWVNALDPEEKKRRMEILYAAKKNIRR